MQHPKRLRAACAVLAAVCAISFAGSANWVFADEASDLAQQLQQAQQEKEQAEKDLEQAKETTEYEKQVSQQLKNNEETLRSEISSLVGQISSKNEEIAAKQNEIAQKQAEIDEKQAEIDERWDNFKERIAAMQVMQSGGTIAMLGQVTDLASFLTFADSLQQISKYDNQVLEEMAAEKSALEQLQAELEIQQTELETQKLDLENQKSQLDVTKAALSQQIQQQDEKVSEASANEEAAQAEYEAAYKIWQEAQAEFDRLAQSNPGSEVIGDGTRMWPLPGYTTLSSYFGEDREIWPGYWDYGHGGVDIPAPAGTPIHVFQSGTVYSSYLSASYGNVVMVDHGNGLVSIYAHMTARLASVGQVVNVGDVIGTVGSTGQSSGNHLHFEMRQNGVRVNPLNYISPY